MRLYARPAPTHAEDVTAATRCCRLGRPKRSQRGEGATSVHDVTRRTPTLGAFAIEWARLLHVRLDSPLDPPAPLRRAASFCMLLQPAAWRGSSSLSAGGGVTGVRTRRSFMTEAQHALAEPPSARGTPVLPMLELDRFKRVEDRYGHVCGGLVLSGFARTLRDIGPADAMIGRCGGEGFSVLLHAATPAAGHAHAQRLCDAVRARVFVTGNPRLTLTVSIGVAGAPDGDTLEALLLSADRRLYVAKVSGRDRVLGTDAPSATQSETGACDEERTHGAGTNAAAAGASPVPAIEAASVGDGRTAPIA